MILLAGMNMVNSTSWSKIHKYNSQVGEDDVFMVNIFFAFYRNSIIDYYYLLSIFCCCCRFVMWFFFSLYLKSIQFRHWIYHWIRLNQDLRQKEMEVKVRIFKCNARHLQNIPNLYHFIVSTFFISQRIDSGDRNQNIHIISDTIAVPSIGAHSKSPPTINKQKPKPQQQSLATISTSADQQQPSVHVPPGENYSYVQLTAVHDYNYPVVEEPIGCIIRNTREESPISIKKRSPTDVFAQSLKETHTTKNRMRCR